jgi:hypothetical protein
MASSPPEPENMLPLTPAEFHILLALADRDRHGYSIMQEITECFSAERIKHMLPLLRRSMIVTFGAFVLFGLAYLYLLRIIDPLPPFEAVGRLHPEIGLAYTLIRDSADLAFLTVVASGLLLFGLTLKQALVARQRDVLVRFGWTALTMIVFVVGTVILFELPRALVIDPWIQIAYLGFGLLCLIGSTVLVSQIILRSTWGPKIGRFVLLCMALLMLTMGVSLLATIVWIVRLWMAVPQFAASQGLDPAGLLGNLGGSTGVALVILTMFGATAGVLSALWRGLHARPSPSI